MACMISFSSIFAIASANESVSHLDHIRAHTGLEAELAGKVLVL